ncbi:MAG: hypothetical protein CM1200mP14_08950 [Gammaproteobacteria bacterium]|nr:MAG: hypothetical protein CM1200mP14_08950 [Gammaproteobacteria bacterium]
MFLWTASFMNRLPRVRPRVYGFLVVLIPWMLFTGTAMAAGFCGFR